MNRLRPARTGAPRRLRRLARQLCYSSSKRSF